MHTLAVIVPSLRRDSINRKLAEALAVLGRKLFSFDFVKLEDIPFFNEDLEKNLPPAVVAMKSVVAASDGVLIVTPEYNRSFPAVLKNALDWGSRPYGKGVWVGKCVASTGISPGPVGTAVCQSQLRALLAFLGARQMTSPEACLRYTPNLFTPDGGLAEEGTRAFLNTFLESFAAWVETAPGRP
ncbi:MAG: NAD(P)H-dependent oxidoreductase [Desulfovibrio sp.]|jgi:chromate reductase|nr:NAD(P)H-dependent oxidoreductase [Desulfovibrio sp.]